MDRVLKPIHGFLKLDEVCIDNNIFRLHYKVTMVLLVLMSLLVTETQYWGDPIDCMSNSDIDFLDTICWIQSTFTIPDVEIGAHAGVGSIHKSQGGQHTIKYHNYYQWVTIILYFQALSFYVPRYLWKIWEGGKMKMLVKGLQYPCLDEEEVEKKKEYLITYLGLNHNDNGPYAYKFIICEILNFINVVAQMMLTNKFVGGAFSDYGTKVFGQSETAFFSRNDTLEYVFPKVTKCGFHYYGPSGSRQNVDAICVLPLNVFNEKIYIILWFWFIFVAVVSGLSLVYRMATFNPQFRQILLKNKAKIISNDNVMTVNNDCQFGDWFLLYQISKSVDLNIFKDIIEEMAFETSKFK